MFTRHIYFENIGLTLLFWVFFNYFNFLPMLEWFNLDLLLFRLISSNGQLTKHSSNGSCFIIVFIQKRCCLNICLVGRLLFFALIGQHLAFVLFLHFPQLAVPSEMSDLRNFWLHAMCKCSEYHSTCRREIWWLGLTVWCLVKLFRVRVCLRKRKIIEI